MLGQPPPSSRPEPFRFDPICGSRLPALYGVNPYSDDHRTYFFCSAECRNFFLEHSQLQRYAGGALESHAHVERERASS